jgi:hypothetical protein
MSKISEAARVASTKVTEGSRELTRKVAEQHIGEKVATSFSAVSAAVTDPDLLTNVQKGASSFWQRATAVGESMLCFRCLRLNGKTVCSQL